MGNAKRIIAVLTGAVSMSSMPVYFFTKVSFAENNKESPEQAPGY
jgi:hypothetical protein